MPERQVYPEHRIPEVNKIKETLIALIGQGMISSFEFDESSGKWIVVSQYGSHFYDTKEEVAAFLSGFGVAYKLLAGSPDI